MTQRTLSSRESMTSSSSLASPLTILGNQRSLPATSGSGRTWVPSAWMRRRYVSMFIQILDNYAMIWPRMAQGETLKNCVKAALSLYYFFEKTMKPTPSKFLYYFNIRHFFKIMYGIAEVDPSYLSSEFNFGKLWLDESTQ